MKIKIFGAIILALLLAQGFIGGLEVSSLERLYSQSLISSYRVMGNDLVNNITSALRFGKSFDKFFGIKDLFEDTKKQLPDMHNVLVVNEENRILYSLDASLEGRFLDDYIGKPANSGSSKYGAAATVTNGVVYTFFPLIDKKGARYGRLGLSFQEAIILRKLRPVVWSNLKLLALTTGGAALLLGLGLLFFIGPDINSSRKRLYLLIIVSFFCSQLVYSYFSINFFKAQYLEIVRSKADSLALLLKEDIEYLFGKGLNIGRLVKIDVLLSDIVKATPEISDISIQDAENRHRYMADQSGVVKIGKGRYVPDERPVDAYFDLMVPLYKIPKKAPKDSSGKVLEGSIRVHLSRAFINHKVRNLILDSATVALISFLFVFELLFLLLLFMRRGWERRDSESSGQSGAWGIVRPISFIYLLAVSLSHSFIPLKMQDIYHPFLGLSKNIVLALPISVEMLAAGLSLVPVGIWLDRRGWFGPLLFGIAASAAGAVLSGLATSSTPYILARSISGIGYGITWISAQGFVVQCTGPGSRAQGISNLVAGLFAGQICGAALGGMLAERMGYSNVFTVAAFIFGLLFLMSLMILKNIKGPVVTESRTPITFSLRPVVRFLNHRKVMSALFFSVVPLNFCIVGLLYYFSPLYLKSLGSTQSDIGRVLMIFGLFSIYFAPFVGKAVDRSKHKAHFIVLSGLIGSFGFLAFGFMSGFGVMVMAVTLLGLASSLGASAQTIYILNSRAAEQIGPGKALSIQRTVDKLGQMLGPLILGALIAGVGIDRGLYVVGLFYFGATVLFLLLTPSKSRSTVS